MAYGARRSLARHTVRAAAHPARRKELSCPPFAPWSPDGGTYEVTQDVGTEILAMASTGDHHFTDWTVTDRASGRTGTIDDYLARGIHLGLSRRF